MVQCDITGGQHPKKEVIWYQDGVQIQIDQRKYRRWDMNTLEITNLQPKDSGNYTCTLNQEQTSGLDHVHTPFPLNVICK